MLHRLGDRDWGALVGALEAGVAAGVAWWLASAVLGVDRPLYAPVAAVVITGAGFSRRISRVKAMLGGMAIAVVVSELGVRFFGSGPIQMALLTSAAILVARLLAEEQLAVLYAGLNAAMLVAVGGDGWVPDRALEAAVGAASAYVLVYLLFPPRPATWVRRAMREQVTTAQENLALAARALRRASAETARESERRSEQIDRKVDRLVETIDFSREVTRFSPWRRPHSAATEELIERAGHLQSILRDSTVAVRMASRHAVDREAPHPHLADALDAHARTLEAMLGLVAGAGGLDEVLAANRRARELALADCEADSALHFAIVEELVSVSDRVASWAGEVPVDAGLST